MLLKHGINIGTMQVGRADIGGEAIMVLTLDKKLNPKVLKELSSIEGINEAQVLELSNVE